jgi:hypothetical protein
MELREPLDGAQVPLFVQEKANQTDIGLEGQERSVWFQQNHRTSRSFKSHNDTTPFLVRGQDEELLLGLCLGSAAESVTGWEKYRIAVFDWT